MCQKGQTHLPKAPFSQNLDEHEVLQVHPFDFRSDVTLDASIFMTSFAGSTPATPPFLSATAVVRPDRSI